MKNKIMKIMLLALTVISTAAPLEAMYFGLGFGRRGFGFGRRGFGFGPRYRYRTRGYAPGYWRGYGYRPVWGYRPFVGTYYW